MSNTRQKNYDLSRSLVKWPYIFLSPYVLLYLAFGFFPLVFTLYISLTDWNGIGTRTFVGFENYINLFTKDPLFFKSLGNTFGMMIIFLPLLVIFPLILANMLFGNKIRCSRFFQVANFLPYITTPVAAALVFYMCFDLRTGFVNMILMQLQAIQQEIPFLQTAKLAPIVLIILVYWKQAGYYMVIYLAGLSTVPVELYEAADIDGANSLKKFFYITIPSIRQTIIFLAISGMIWGFQLVEEPMILFSTWGGGSTALGGPDYSCLTTTWYMYDTSFGSNMQYGKGSAIAYSLFVIILAVTLIGNKLMNRRRDTV